MQNANKVLLVHIEVSQRIRVKFSGGGPHKKDYDILGSILGVPYLWKLRYAWLNQVENLEDCPQPTLLNLRMLPFSVAEQRHSPTPQIRVRQLGAASSSGCCDGIKALRVQGPK